MRKQMVPPAYRQTTVTCALSQATAKELSLYLKTLSDEAKDFPTVKRYILNLTITSVQENL